MKRIKPFIAYGEGFSGNYETEEEAASVVAKNGNGAIFRMVSDGLVKLARIASTLDAEDLKEVEIYAKYLLERK